MPSARPADKLLATEHDSGLGSEPAFPEPASLAVESLPTDEALVHESSGIAERVLYQPKVRRIATAERCRHAQYTPIEPLKALSRLSANDSGYSGSQPSGSRHDLAVAHLAFQPTVRKRQFRPKSDSQYTDIEPPKRSTSRSTPIRRESAAPLYQPQARRSVNSRAYAAVHDPRAAARQDSAI